MYIGNMTDPRFAPAFAYVHPVFWPWLWLQLWAIAKYQKETGQHFLLRITRYGSVHLKYASDRPKPKPKNLYKYEAPAVPAWERPALGSDLPIEFAKDTQPFILNALTDALHATIAELRTAYREPAPNTS
ncbi:hypothetical protein HY29_05660 [Hyphomonas beringensis]|uniref:Uncharacterized protein n=2 Tax=Hyphomonas beringensis TaxID=1280946 RepID=A0A062TTN8_9PROT|nr:hypothetical protein HY29_05660 [Hyphomonas beringensis]